MTAFNSIGDSASSEISTGIAMPIDATVPDAPTNLARDWANTNKTKVAFTWSAPVNNGGASIDSYLVMWDEGTGSGFVQADANILTTSYSRTGLVAGTTYKFKV